MIAGAAAAIALALLHPSHHAHHGRLSLLLEQTRSGMPTFQMLSAVVLDPTLGLIGNFPLFLIVVAAGSGTLVRRGGIRRCGRTPLFQRALPRSSCSPSRGQPTCITAGHQA
jgi:hypothetical protein